MIVKYYMENGLPALCRINNIYCYGGQITLCIDGDTSNVLVSTCENEEEYKHLISCMCLDYSLVTNIPEKYKFMFVSCE